jgi:hypothetical protein
VTTPETDPYDAAEQQAPVADAGSGLPTGLPDAVPEGDAVEQALSAGPEAGTRLPDSVPLEATEADAVEQAQDVPLDEDEGRE